MKDNRGFSLVELIVVVLIMAIVAVALAPQVVKWVENSRIASDLETRTDIEKMCQYALTNEDIFKEVKNGGYTITITKGASGNPGTTVSCLPTGTGNFWNEFFAIGGYANEQDFKDSIEIKSTPVNDDGIVLKVYVFEDGHTFSTLTGVYSAEIKVS